MQRPGGMKNVVLPGNKQVGRAPGVSGEMESADWGWKGASAHHAGAQWEAAN